MNYQIKSKRDATLGRTDLSQRLVVGSFLEKTVFEYTSLLIFHEGKSSHFGFDFELTFKTH